jgi:hypothetical protein
MFSKLKLPVAIWKGAASESRNFSSQLGFFDQTNEGLTNTLCAEFVHATEIFAA